MKTLGQAAMYFGQLAIGGYKLNLVPILDMIGAAVKTEVEKEIGEYQGSIGPFPATAPLADATLERKGRDNLGKGGDPNTPLYATGKFHDSIGTAKDINSLSVEIGTDVEYIIEQELGTSRIPPRPVFGPATLRALPPLEPAITASAALGIVGGVWKGLAVEGITAAGGKATANILP